MVGKCYFCVGLVRFIDGRCCIKVFVVKVICVEWCLGGMATEEIGS